MNRNRQIITQTQTTQTQRTHSINTDIDENSIINEYTELQNNTSIGGQPTIKLDNGSDVVIENLNTIETPSVIEIEKSYGDNVSDEQITFDSETSEMDSLEWVSVRRRIVPEIPSENPFSDYNLNNRPSDFENSNPDNFVQEARELLERLHNNSQLNMSEADTELLNNLNNLIHTHNARIAEFSILRERVLSRMASITSNEWFCNLFNLVLKFRDSPLYIKMLLVSGGIFIIGGTIYIGYRLVRKMVGEKPNVTTIITPFGPRRNLTMVGRVLEAIIFKE